MSARPLQVWPLPSTRSPQMPAAVVCLRPLCQLLPRPGLEGDTRRGWKAFQAGAQATGAVVRRCRESDAERHSPRLEIEGRQVYRLQSPRLEGRHSLWFQSLELQELAGSAQGTALLVLQPLGWRIAEDPNKCLPFSKVFSAVGSSFSLARAPQGNWEISNKEGRLPALRTMVNSVCNKGFDQPAVLASLKGRFLYASTHTFGSVAHLAGRRHLEARQRRLHPATANHRPPRGHAPARELRRHQRSSCGGQAPLCFDPYIWARC